MYRALRLLVDAGTTRAIAGARRRHAVGDVGGTDSRRGKRADEGRRLGIGFGDENVAYELRLGLPAPPVHESFMLDPEVKEETIRTVEKPTSGSSAVRHAGRDPVLVLAPRCQAAALR